VLVPSGKKSVTITLTAAKVTSATTVTIKASRGTANASTDVTVNP